MHGYNDSATGYDKWRRRRRWSMDSRNGLQGYAAYLAGADDGGDFDVGPMIGAETAAYEASGGSESSKVILVGVATGVLTFLLNRWLGKVLG